MLLTTKQAQEYYKVSYPTLIKYAEQGKVPVIRIGKFWRFIVSKEDYKR